MCWLHWQNEALHFCSLNDFTIRKTLIVDFNPYGSPFFNPKCLLSNLYKLNVPMNMLKNMVAQDMHLTLEVKASLHDDAYNSLINCIRFE